MKAFFPLILFLSLPIIGFAQQDYPDSGFTNKAEAKNLMVNGLKEGKWVEYSISYDDGMIDTNSYRLVLYKDNNPFGLVRDYYYYLSNKLKGMTFFLNGKENGIAKTYFMSGHLESITPFNNGERNGMYKLFYESGKIMQEMPYVNGKTTGTVYEYDESGNIEKEYYYSNDTLNGMVHKYYMAGKLIMETPYMNGDINGIEKVYYDDGKIRSETVYKNGKKRKTINYDENGKEIK